MKTFTKAWNYLLTEPSKWLFHYFFQPSKFKEELRNVQNSSIFKPLISGLRLIFIMFLLSYPLALLLRMSLLLSSGKSFTYILNGGSFFLTMARDTALGVLSGSTLGAIGGDIGIVALGIMGGIMTNIPFGIAGGLTVFASFGIPGLLILGIEGLVVGGLTAGVISGIKQGPGKGIKRGIWVGLRTCLAVLIAVSIVTLLVRLSPDITTTNTIQIILEDIFAGMFLGLALELKSGIILGVVLSTAKLLTGDIQTGINVGVAFFLSYFLGYIRLPLYLLFSCPSVLRASWLSRRNPPLVFHYLEHSALYWDERVYLRLYGLKPMLFIAMKQDEAQNEERTIRVLRFISHQRPQQSRVAWVASLELVMRDLEKRDSLREVATASEQIMRFLSPEVRLLDPQWVPQFARLNDASRDADSYYSTTMKEEKSRALENIRWNLKRASSLNTLRENTYNERFGKVVHTWQAIAQDEQKSLEKIPLRSGQLDNPYVAGPVLSSNSSLFVGRHDLKQQLMQALNRGSNRPTFFLVGERRMGKTSTLRQLPNFLGSHYLPIVINLQSPYILSSISTFLTALAEEIYKVACDRGMPAKRLEYKRLEDARMKGNEAATYRPFNEWLDKVEGILRDQDRTLLLAFDEFENLEVAELDGYLNLDHLLKWFRSSIQDRSHVALLFCGLRTIDEMGTNWAKYFVNVQTLKVGLLHLEEARLLITQPVPNFSSEKIFGDKVINEIIRVSGCHPFLVQAVCSELIHRLNREKRTRAYLEDIVPAVDGVLAGFQSYFDDLWERTDRNQRLCLVALKTLGKADLPTIQRKSGLSKQDTYYSMSILCKRDLVLPEDGFYEITASIFGKFIDRRVRYL